MTKKQLHEIINDGIGRRKRFFALKIETEGNAAPEIIVNPFENAAAKMRYIDAAYNDALELIKAKESGKSIRIVDAVVGNTLAGLDWFAV